MLLSSKKGRKTYCITVPSQRNSTIHTKKTRRTEGMEKSIAILKKNMRQIEKAIGKEIINERRDRK